MAETLRLTNFPEINLVEKTEVREDVSAGATTLKVKNADGLSDTSGDEDFIIIGPPGTDSCEKKKITGISDNDLTVDALDFDHKKFTEVVSLRGDQIRVYRAANVDGSVPDDDDFSSIATVTLEHDQQHTEYEDSSGGSGFWYKQTFVHSTQDTETDLADSDAVRGGGFGNLVSIDQVRRSAGFQGNPNITDEMIAEAREDAEGVVKGAVFAGGYTLPLGSPIPRSIVRLTRQLAAAYLLQDEYGTAAQGTNKDGFEKEDRVMEKLTAIQNGDVTLLDAHEDTPISDRRAIKGWPDSTTEDQDEDDAGGKRSFTIKQEF